eukprot:447252_1
MFRKTLLIIFLVIQLKVGNSGSCPNCNANNFGGCPNCPRAQHYYFCHQGFCCDDEVYEVCMPSSNTQIQCQRTGLNQGDTFNFANGCLAECAGYDQNNDCS